MKKFLFGVTVLGITVLALSVVSIAFAHGTMPGNPDGSNPYGAGHMGGSNYGRMSDNSGYGTMSWNGEDGPMHDAMVASMAESLGISAEDIEARHDAGETLWDIAESRGLSADEIQTLMISIHDTTLAEAVSNGWLTQDQAEWMDGHMNSMWEGANTNIGFHGMNW